MIRADLHVHTAYSADASIPPKTIVEQLNAHPFIKAVAITDHNTFEGYCEVQQLASAYPDVQLIPGVEISTTNGDVILLGITELPPKPWTVQNVIDFTKQKKALTVAAHPYRAPGLGDLARNYDFDAIETLNGASTASVNKQAENLAKEMKLPGVAGSDAHRTEELWTAYTEIHASSDTASILEAISRGQVRVVQTEKSIRF